MNVQRYEQSNCKLKLLILLLLLVKIQIWCYLQNLSVSDSNIKRPQCIAIEEKKIVAKHGNGTCIFDTQHNMEKLTICMLRVYYIPFLI